MDWVDRSEAEQEAGKQRAAEAAFGVLGRDFLELDSGKMLLRLCEAVDAIYAFERSDEAEIAQKHPPGTNIHGLYLDAASVLADALSARMAQKSEPVASSDGGVALLVFTTWARAVEGLFLVREACRDAADTSISASGSKMLREIYAKKYGEPTE